MVQAFVPVDSTVWAAQQLQSAHLPFSDSEGQKTLHVAMHCRESYHIS